MRGALPPRRLALPAIAAALVAALALPSAAAATDRPGCGPARGVPGGEWPTYGHDYSNTRFQRREKVISPADAPFLAAAWSFSTVDGGGGGDITGTPVVSDGCAYVATNDGWVFALNADTGERVWKRQVPYEGGVSSSVALTERLAYVAVSRTQKATGCARRDPCVGPYVVALHRDSGRIAWTTPSLDTQPGSDTFGSPLVLRGALMIGISGGAAELGDEADRYAFQGSMVFLDAGTGALLRKTWTIHPPGHPKDDFAGGGIWSTPAIDRSTGVAYVGAANPFRPQAEADNTNAVLKFDVDPESPRFGRIVGSYKGLVDEYYPAITRLPCFDIPGNPPPYYPQGIGSCGDLDLDFGASPNLFTSATGRKLVGAGQKSGVYHVFDARTMKPVWTQIVGPPGSLGGIVGSTAYDGGALYGPITVPGYLWSLTAARGSHRWIAPVADGVHWGPPVAVANGVVYTVDLTGFLDAYDARSGAQLAKRPIALGGGGPLALSWGGVSVARNTIYAAVGIRGLPEGLLVAFRRGTVNDLVEDVQRALTDLQGGIGGIGAPGGSTILAGPDAKDLGYATPAATTGVGGPLSFTNLDIAQHDVTAVQKDATGQPLFRSPLIGLGQTAPVEGLDRVRSGHSYAFFCSIHPGMRGTLVVR